MQTIVTLDWTRSVAKEVIGAMPSLATGRHTGPAYKIYLEHVHHLFDYGMNACDDRALVKNCIVKCFLVARTRSASSNAESFGVDLFKEFRQLLIKKTGTNLFPSESQKTKELTSLQHEALFLKFQRKLSYREVADIMELPIEQLRAHVSKAIGILLRERREIDRPAL